MPAWLGWAVGAASAWAVEATEPDWACYRGIGAAFGVNAGVQGWEQVGRGGVSPASSVLVSLNCAVPRGERKLQPALGVDFAPFYVQPVWDGTRMRQFAVAHGTAWWGTDRFHVGPHLRAGYTALGAGLSAGWWSTATNRPSTTGVEARLSAYYLGNLGVQAGVMVTSRRGVRR